MNIAEENRELRRLLWSIVFWLNDLPNDSQKIIEQADYYLDLIQRTVRKDDYTHNVDRLLGLGSDDDD